MFWSSHLMVSRSTTHKATHTGIAESIRFPSKPSQRPRRMAYERSDSQDNRCDHDRVDEPFGHCGSSADQPPGHHPRVLLSAQGAAEAG